jgi:hypothetical protein
MPDIKIIGRIGAHFDVEANFEIADVDHLTEFTKVREIGDASYRGSPNEVVEKRSCSRRSHSIG